MSIHRFFYDPKLSHLSARLDSKGLTIKEMREIEDKVFFLVSEENAEFTSELFQRLFVKRSDLVKKELDKLIGKETLCAHCERLQWTRSEMSFEALEEALCCLECEVALSNEGTKEAKEFVEHLRFLREHPVLEEIEENSLYSNFSSRLASLQEEILEQDSLTPLKSLTAAQNREIFGVINQRGVA